MPLRLVYLCRRETYLRKMSRVRFHSIAAIERRPDVELVWSGPGWDGWDEARPVQDNLDALYAGRPEPELVIAYKPLEMPGFAQTRAPRCIRYNEMYDPEWTLREIRESASDLVVCHHRNDMLEWRQRLAGQPIPGQPIRLVDLAHCAEQTLYRDWGLPKTVDVLLVGALGIQTRLGRHYPLRDRMVGVLKQLSSRYRCALHAHPGYDLADASTDRNTRAYSQALNSAKICVTCSGAPRSRFGKYVEIPRSGPGRPA